MSINWDRLTGFTPRAVKALQLANQEAHRLNHNYLGTEHLLLGLVKEEFAVASQILRGVECFLPKARWAVEKLVAQKAAGVVPGRLAWSSAILSAFERASEHARDLHHVTVGTGHLLLALIDFSEAGDAPVLGGLVQDVSELRNRVLTALSSEDWSHLEEYSQWNERWGPYPELNQPS